MNIRLLFFVYVFLFLFVNLARADQLEDLLIYDKIKVGFNRQEVMDFAGNPVLEVTDDEWYFGGAPSLKTFQSPISPHRIQVKFKNNLVISIKFYANFQEFLLRKEFDQKLMDRLMNSGGSARVR